MTMMLVRFNKCEKVVFKYKHGKLSMLRGQSTRFKALNGVNDLFKDIQEAIYYIDQVLGWNRTN